MTILAECFLSKLDHRSCYPNGQHSQCCLRGSGWSTSCCLGLCFPFHRLVRSSCTEPIAELRHAHLGTQPTQQTEEQAFKNLCCDLQAANEGRAEKSAQPVPIAALPGTQPPSVAGFVLVASLCCLLRIKSTEPRGWLREAALL